MGQHSLTESPRRPAIAPVSPSIRISSEPPQIAEPLVSFLAPGSFEADQYRTLRHIVERLRRDSGIQVLAVTSSCAGEGKSITTLNLAGALSQSREARVLLIDADLRRPSVAPYLGLARDRAPALAEAIVDPECSLAQAVRHLEWANLAVLPAGDARGGFYELLNSPRLETLLNEARGLYDYVLLDTPPVVPLPDCRLIGRWVDGFLVVVAANQTPRKMLGEALSFLDPAKVIGLVFNRETEPASSAYGYYGYYSKSHSHLSQARAGWWARARTAARNLRRPPRPR
jgi:capsular exopolysaccharide synthesis family protein